MRKQIAKHYVAPRADGSDRVISACCKDHPEEVRFSALSDAVMGNIAACLKEYIGKDSEVFMKVWTASIFPERLTACVEQIVEDLQLIILDNPTK